MNAQVQVPLKAFERLADAARSFATAAGWESSALTAAPIWPNSRAEQWRHANLRSLDAVTQFAPPAPIQGPGSLPATLEALVPAELPGYRRLCLCNGQWLSAQSDATLRPTIRSQVNTSVGTAGFEQVARLFQASELALSLGDGDQIELLHISAAPLSGYARVAIDIASGARVRLIERHLSVGPTAALQAPVLALGLGVGATLDHYRSQYCDSESRWFDTLRCELAADSRWKLRQISLGAHTARSTIAARLSGTRAEFSMHAVAVGAEQQTHDTSVTVEHIATHGRSVQVFRGIAADRSRVAVSADIRVAATAAGTDVSQSLKGLAESAGAEIDLAPRLTILTDDVKARHGATTGQLDEQLMFYMLSRGLARDAARSLLIWAFLGDALREVDLPELRAATAQAVAGRLGAAWLTEATT